MHSVTRGRRTNGAPHNECVTRWGASVRSGPLDPSRHGNTDADSERDLGVIGVSRLARPARRASACSEESLSQRNALRLVLSQSGHRLRQPAADACERRGP